MTKEYFDDALGKGWVETEPDTLAVERADRCSRCGRFAFGDNLEYDIGSVNDDLAYMPRCEMDSYIESYATVQHIDGKCPSDATGVDQ